MLKHPAGESNAVLDRTISHAARMSPTGFSILGAPFHGAQLWSRAMKFRTLLFWPHLIAGVIAGVVILVMSVTGVLLTYERQIEAWADSHLRSAPPSADARRMPVETLLATMARDHPDVSPTTVAIESAPDAPVAYSVARRTLYVDAYSGRLLGEGNEGVRGFLGDIRSWHRWFAVEGEGRATARAVTGWSNLLFLFIVMSGIYLWFPRTWTWAQFKAVLAFRRAYGTSKARDFNWHNVIGAWSAIPLFIVVLTAVPISFPWASALVYRAVGEEPPARGGGGAAGARGAGPGRAAGAGRAGADGGRAGAREARREPSPAVSYAGLNALWARAEQQVPAWRTISLRLPTVDEAPAVFSIDRGDGGQPHLRSTLTLGRDGRVVASEAFADLSLGRRIRNLMRFAHTGEVLGVPGQTVAGLVSAGGVVMVWTGLALAWRRFRAWRAKPNQGLRQPVAGTGSVAASVRACQSRFIFRADHRALHRSRSHAEPHIRHVPASRSLVRASEGPRARQARCSERGVCRLQQWPLAGQRCAGSGSDEERE
jgi:uncharacterized iron-regulated membrane protein